MDQWGCRPTTILRVGRPGPSCLRTFVVKNRGLARAAGPIVIAPQRGRLSDVGRHGGPAPAMTLGNPVSSYLPTTV